LKPEDRYELVEALQADLERWLADEPVSAWREPLLIRMRRWARRHRIAVSLATACLFTAIVSLGVGTLRAERQAQVVANYEVASETLVEIMEVMAQDKQPFDIVPPSVHDRMKVPDLVRDLPEPETLERLRALRDRFRKFKSRLESTNQDRMAQRLDEIIKRYDRKFIKVAGFGGGGAAAFYTTNMLGD
jgi:hypothetical protein